MQRALAAAQASGEPTVLARAWALEATHLTDTGRSVSQALASLRRAEATAFPDGPYTLRRSILFALANACFQLGRYEDALGYYQRVEALTVETGDQLTRASARYNVVNTRMRQMEEMPRPGAREEIVAQAQAALETAVEADNREIQVLLHRTLGELFEGPEGRPDESRAHYRRCIDLARRIDQPRELAHCLWSLAGELAEKGEHREARRVMDEALALASGTGHVWSIAHASRKRMRVSWATLPVEQALPESLQSLAAIEAVRDLQQEEGAASVFSAWVSDYQWLAGRLLESPARSRESIEQAFAVVERMRARSLLDALRAAKVSPPETQAQADERKAVLRQIVDAHLARLHPGTSAEARGELERRLQALDAQERRLRADVRPEIAEAPAFAGLREIEQQLGPREALLSYHIGLDANLLGEPAGGGWVTVSTQGGTTAHRVVDRARLRDAVPIFLGLFAARDGREARPGTTLYRDLLASAVAALPDGVDRLLIVPDDVLHTLPFAALRATPEDEPLASRFEVTIAPSATLWLRFRQAARANAPRTALVLADPDLPGSVEARAEPSRERGGTGSSLDSLALGPLPHARQEGRQVTRRLAGTLRVGAAASERQLKMQPAPRVRGPPLRDARRRRRQVPRSLRAGARGLGAGRRPAAERRDRRAAALGPRGGARGVPLRGRVAARRRGGDEPRACILPGRGARCRREPLAAPRRRGRPGARPLLRPAGTRTEPRRGARRRSTRGDLREPAASGLGGSGGGRGRLARALPGRRPALASRGPRAARRRRGPGDRHARPLGTKPATPLGALRDSGSRSFL